MSRAFLTAYLFAIGFVVLFFALEGVGAPVDPLDTLLAFLIVFGPWLAGGLLGWLCGRTWLRVAGVTAFGLVLTAAGLAAFLFVAGSSQDAACGEDECFHYFGHWIEASLAVQWPIYAVVAWAFSVLVLSRLRLSREREGGTLSSP